jgi:arabinofuranan 3-O-arabinosyltransferase
MANYEMSPERGAGAKLGPATELICFALIVANLVYVIAFSVQCSCPVVSNTPGDIPDFATFWVAGEMVRTGHAAAAYDWSTLKPLEENLVGHFDGYLPWNYPPPFLSVAVALSLLPYASAFIVWVFGTFAAYLAAIRAIIGDRLGYFLAAAFPAVLGDFMVGQNGFLSTALIGGALTFMDRRPIAAGVMIGLLTYKPQLGVLFPIALVVSGRWLVFATAGIVAALMMAGSWAAFGAETWLAFFRAIGLMAHSDGLAYWGKLQSALGFARAFSDNAKLAWTTQMVTALIAAGGIGFIWRSRCAYEIKAAALGTGVLMATPHLLAYDLIVLAVPLAFLIRLGRTSGFLRHELSGIGLACLLVLIYPFVQAPVGFLAILIVAALIACRILAVRPGAPQLRPLAPSLASPVDSSGF